MLANGAHAMSMANHRMMKSLVNDLWFFFPARRVATDAIAVVEKHGDFVERNPALHPIAVRLDNLVSVIGKRVSNEAGGPATLVFERLGEIPVKHRHPRRDSPLEKRID